MRLQQYIKEGRSKGIGEDDAIQTIVSRCSDSYKAAVEKKAVIYRGLRGSSTETMEIDPKRGRRRSRNTLNYYTLFMDNEGTFKDYPKRSKSVVCSTDLSKAMRYGRSYVLLPENGAKIGIVKHGDIFDVGALGHGTNLGSLNASIDELIQQYMISASRHGHKELVIDGPWENSWVKLKSVNTTIKRMNKIPEIWDEIDSWLYQYESKVFYNMWMSGPNLMTFYKNTLDKNVEFDLKKAGDSLNEYNRNEVWTDGYSILIDTNLWDYADFHQQIISELK